MKKIGLELVAKNLASPLSFKSDGTGKHYILQQKGLISLMEKGRPLRKKEFLDISDKVLLLDPLYEERGLLGLAFHPDFKNNGRFFVYYSGELREEADQRFCCTNYISEFTAEGNNADKRSEKIILSIDKPQANHNGGDLCFGPDGYLYISIGDGGGANDTAYGHSPGSGNSQDTSKLLGKIIRIDVDSGDPYSIPTDNPFLGNVSEKREEIWAYGLRNPWRMSFDPETNDLYCGDAGQDLWEEINIITKGGNYGWNIMEGTHYFDPEDPLLERSTPRIKTEENLIGPIIEAPNTRNRQGLGGVAIIGGYVYRGSTLPYQGDYIFGFWSEANKEPRGVLAIASSGQQKDKLWEYEQLVIENGDGEGKLDDYLLAFGEDEDKELYIMTQHTSGRFGFSGKIWKLVL